jgi:hypothetical protein
MYLTILIHLWLAANEDYHQLDFNDNPYYETTRATTRTCELVHTAVALRVGAAALPLTGAIVGQ